ncbi:30S ribosomal protein S1 [Candidatus Jorgensenbacteria bacterium]|nr:30S ribosomal protein S1 [Candidatus Jorgensenbacteria bacterium]
MLLFTAMGAQKSTNNIVSLLSKLEPAAFSLLKPGDLVEGVVLDKGSNKLLVDLGKHSTGAVYRSELQEARDLVKNLKVGDIVHAKVIEVDNRDGYVELSLSEAGKQKSWTEVLELREKEEPITVVIGGFNRGGLTTSIKGLGAFLPISQLALEHYPKVTGDDRTALSQSLEKLVGAELTVKIIDVNPRTDKLIISEREATKISTKELVKNYTVGQIIEGIVSGIADFGVFVRFTDNPDVEGLVHASELDHRIVDNPKEVVKIDEAVKVKIIDIKDGKISLSLKALQDDPWLSVAGRFREGESVSGKAYSFNPFGAVIDLGAGIQGQLRVTEFGGVEEMKKQIILSKDYIFVIESFVPEERRIVLKLKK